ncbi:MAG: FAD-dependent monooxygenase [Bryobacterales bacterium]|nr:FAD-dependent monooxygenase [Bryobacterales bacterium]
MGVRVNFDVAVVGGGPAGSAAALSLRQVAPWLSIVMIEQSRYGTVRAGEVIPGQTLSLLQQLGAGRRFLNEGFHAAPEIASAWGGPELRRSHHIYSAHGPGWHLDRAAFDQLLASEASARGVDVRLGTAVRRIERVDDGWRLDLSAAEAGSHTLAARFAVDATGRPATVARRAGARRVVQDHLTAFLRYFDCGHSTLEGADGAAIVEACAEGWWYTAAIGRAESRRVRVAAFLTDPIHARELRPDRAAQWQRLVANTCWIHSALKGHYSSGDVMVRPAGTATLDRVCGGDWFAVGDAATSHDPLSGQGILRALRSGIAASFAIAEAATGQRVQAEARYQRFISSGFAHYLNLRHLNYGAESRWTRRPFWKARLASLPPSAGRSLGADFAGRVGESRPAGALFP